MKKAKVIDFNLSKTVSTNDEKVSVTISSLLKTGGFTQEHLDYLTNEVLPFLKVHYPELYGDKLPPGMKFIGFKILGAVG